MPLTCQTSHATVCHPADAVLVSLPTPRSRQPARRCRSHHGYGAPPQWDTAISAEPVAILPGRTTPPTRHHQIFTPRPGPPSHLTRPDGDLPVGPSPRSELGDTHATESAADMLFCPLVFGDMSELHPIGHRLFVALRYHHLPPPNRKEVANQVTGPRSASGTHASRRSLARRRICRIVASLPVARWLVPCPPQGLISIGLAPRLAPQRRKGSRSSYVKLRPE